MQFATVAGARLDSYPVFQMTVLLFKGGGYVTFTAVTELTSDYVLLIRNDKWLRLDLEILNQMLRNI